MPGPEEISAHERRLASRQRQPCKTPSPDKYFVGDERLYPVRFRHLLPCPGQDAGFGQATSPDPVHKIHDGIVLLDSLAAEVLPHRICELAFRLAPEGLLSCQCRGVEANTARLR